MSDDWVTHPWLLQESEGRPWLWPVRLRTAPPWNTRLGRVVHWAGTALAIAVAVFGIYITWNAYRAVRAFPAELAAWEQRHAKNRPAVPTVFPPGYPGNITEAETSATDPDPYDFEPYPPGSPWEPFLITAVLTFGLLLIGRGFRYIVGGE